MKHTKLLSVTYPRCLPSSFSPGATAIFETKLIEIMIEEVCQMKTFIVSHSIVAIHSLNCFCSWLWLSFPRTECGQFQWLKSRFLVLPLKVNNDSRDHRHQQ